MSSSNPYKPPETDLAKPGVDSVNRREAKWSVRLAVAFMAMPALANWACLQFLDTAGTGRPGSFYGDHPLNRIIFGGTNLLWTLVALAAAWVLILPVVEKLGEFVWHRTNRQLKLSQWQRSTWKALLSLRFAGPIGAIVWGVWIGYFFFSSLPLSWTPIFWIAGHCAAAIVYGSLVYQWFVASNRTSRSDAGVANGAG